MADKHRRNRAPLARMVNLKSMVRLSGQSVIFPFYHVVSNKHLPHIRHLYRYRKVYEFQDDLEELLRLFHPISLAEYLDDSSRKTGKPKMVLSFDDGLAECHQVIAPILKKMGVPAVFFLNNNFIDNRGLFYRYKASILVDRIRSDCKALENAAEYLVIPEEQVIKALHLVTYKQQPLLDALAPVVETDFEQYMKNSPVYMESGQVKELINWGFDIGGHTADHVDFTSLEQSEMIYEVRHSVDDVQQRFGIQYRYFSFPFTSHGVPEPVIDMLLDKHIAGALAGTAGLKKTRTPGFIQRIPMESTGLHAKDVLKVEYFYYLLKVPLGRNRLRY